MSYRWWLFRGRRGCCLIVVLCVIVYLWYTILTHEDYTMFNQLDIEKDPVYKTHHQRIHISRDANKTLLRKFPVIPGELRKLPTSPEPLSENDVIPANIDFSGSLKNASVDLSSKELLISVVDYGFIDFTINFIRTSIEKLHMKQMFVPVCLDSKSQRSLTEMGYSCILIDLAQNGSLEPTDFGTREYYRKTNIKTWVVLQFLKLGHTVLLSDVDIVLFKDPFAHFTCRDCDVHIQMDRQLYNSGFVFVRPTRAGIRLYSLAWQFYLQYHTGHDQAYVNMAITAMLGNNSILIEELSSRTFPCGVYYFEQDYRNFYNQPKCETCVMAHNNYMGTTAGKIYRFRENLLWSVDTGEYYSSNNAKYLAYENPWDFGPPKTIEMERMALLHGMVIAKLLDRILILPSFRCCNCKTKSCDHPTNRCSLLSVLKMKTFDAAFKGKYREHSFLQHGMVPAAIKNSISPTLYFNTSVSQHEDIARYLTDAGGNHPLVVLNFQRKHVNSDNLITALEACSNYHVIKLHSLYGQFEFNDVIDEHGRRVLDTFSEGVQCGLYQQWEVSMEETFFGKRARKS